VGEALKGGGWEDVGLDISGTIPYHIPNFVQ